MESTLAAFSTISATPTARTTGPSLPRFTISKALNRHSSGANHPLLLARRLGGLGAAGLPVNRSRLQCLSNSSPSFSGGGAGFGGHSGGRGGGGGGGADSGDSKSKLGAGACDGVSVPSSDIIVLNVGGMTCGGCSASVKKILESQPQVASASVNLTTETAIVWPVPEATSVPDWQKTLGETLANHLTNCGFQSTPRGEVPEDIAGEFST